MNPNDRDQILRNCHNPWNGPDRQGVTALRGWHKPGPGQIARLLQAAPAAASCDANALWRHLARQTWRIEPTAAAKPDNARDTVASAGPAVVVRVSVGGRRYHLHCVQTPVLRLVRMHA